MAEEHRLAEGRALRHSRLWALQRRYFAQQGEQAWASGAVPAFPTSNSAIASATARVIAAWAEDMATAVHIVELGAGHGRFGFRCAQHLTAARTPFVYTFTDAAPSNIEAMHRHAFLQPGLRSGVLQAVHHDAVADLELPDGPVVLIAHYCFDSLPTDVFRVRDGVLEEGRTVLTSPAPITEDPSIIDDLDVSFEFEAVDPDGYYGDPELDAILASYRHRLQGGTFCFPIGALRGLQSVLGRGQPVLLLAADKGHVCIEDLNNSDTVGFACHGSFSFMVNFDAIAQLFAGRGGTHHGYATHDGPLEGGGFISAARPAPRTVTALHQALLAFSPSDFYALYHRMEKLKSLDLDTFLAIVRLSGWDPQVYIGLYEKALDEISEVPQDAQHQLLDVVERVWEQAFPIGGDPDVSFALGRTLHQLGRYDMGLAHYKRSIEISGEHPATRYNMGLCRFWMGQKKAAKQELRRALQQDPSYKSARKWLKQLERGRSAG